MTDYRIPPPSTLVDQQFIQVVGPDGLASSFLYDSQSLTLYIKESQIIIPPFHGQTHVTSDLVPTATCDRQGHMSADDKCKLDSMAQTRIGVLGFSGAGFSDDGGFLTGDIILAAGTEFISLERIGNVIRFVCFTGDCGVLLPDGTTKRIDTMVAGEEVVTHDGSVQKVTQLFKNEVHEDILHVEVSGHRKNAFKATCDHPILAIRQPNVGRCSEHRVRNCRRCLDRYAAPEWIRAGELHEGDFIVRRFSSDVVVDKQSVAISDYADDILVKEGKAFSQMKRKMVSNAVGSYEINDEFTTCAVAVVDEIKVDDEFLRLCGYYLAEGSLGRTHGKKATTVQFTISAEEAFDDLGADIVHCIKHVFGITPKIYRNNKRGTAHAVTLHSSIAARFIDHLLPGRCHTKRIPRWMMELSPEKQKQILVGFMRGDGYRRDGQRCRQMMTGICNEQLANQLCALFERIGASPVISYKSQFSKQTGRCYDRYTVQVQASDAPWLWEAMDGKPLNFHRLDFGLKHSGYTLRQVKNIQRVRHDGFVYNIEVEHNHSYVVNGLAVHNCDSPLPLACDCESCFQIYWQQDESDVLAIRPPACNGKLPGVNAYGELKIYLLPETAIMDQTKPLTLLNTKDRYPTFIFKRYDDAISPGSAEMDMVLKRRTNRTTEIGWAFTPGQNSKPECVWFLGDDSGGQQRRFDLNVQAGPSLLGELLYKGHLLTKQMGVVVGYDSGVTTNNQYLVRYWDVNGQQPIDASFTATNVWRYENPENQPDDTTLPRRLVSDGTQNLLPFGTLVDLWEYKVGETNGQPIRRRFFSKQPQPSAQSFWNMGDCIKFGDLLVAREELPEGDASEIDASEVGVADVRLLERTLWGVTGFEDRFIISDDDSNEPSGVTLNHQPFAEIDYAIPGLVVRVSDPTSPVERPIFLWSRHNHRDVYVRSYIGMPYNQSLAHLFPPYDLLLRGPIDSTDDIYLKVIRRGVFTVGPFAGSHYVVVKGAQWHEMPQTGTIRVLTPTHRGDIWKYRYKAAFAHVDDDGLMLIGTTEEYPFPGSSSDFPVEPENVQLLKHDYNSPVVRLEFSVDETTDAEAVQLQIKVGMLDMSIPYELDVASGDDDLVRGLAPGYAVSKVMTQQGFIRDGTETPPVDPTGFRCYMGGYLPTPLPNGTTELWNSLEVMYTGYQCYVWWNGLLCGPDPVASAQLPFPVVANTPYFPLVPNVEYGKVGFRMFPGATVRKMEISEQNTSHTPYQYGQIYV